MMPLVDPPLSLSRSSRPQSLSDRSAAREQKPKQRIGNPQLKRYWDEFHDEQ